MAYLLPSLLCLLGHLLAVEAGQTVLSGLRESTATGMAARFLVSRDDCLIILQERAPGLKLASDVHDREYDTERYSEITVAVVDIKDTTLSAEIKESTSLVSADGKILFVLLPIASGDAVFALILAAYTDESKPLAIPYYTNYKAVTNVDSITITATDNIDLITVQDGPQEGNGQIVLRIEHTTDCVDNADTGHDFDEEAGADLRFTNYPEEFDWGCEMGNFSFCKELNRALEALPRGDVVPLEEGNVCTTMTTGHSTRCPLVSAEISGITGGILPGLQALIGTGPVSAIEGEFINREHTTGIIFPCIAQPSK